MMNELFDALQGLYDWIGESFRRDEQPTDLMKTARIAIRNAKKKDREEKAKDVWAEHPTYLRSEWQKEAGAGDTQLGYWEWCKHKEEQDHDDLRRHNANG
jgi:hypothetical protein